MKNWNKSIWVGIIFGIFSIAYLFFSFGVKTATTRFGIFDGGFMPKLYGGAMLICSIIQLLSGIKEMKSGASEKSTPAPEAIADKRINSVRVALGFSTIILYVFAMKFLGYILSTTIFLFCLCNLLLPGSEPRTKKLKIGIAALAVLLPITTFIFFKRVVNMALPVGTLIKPILNMLGY